MSRTILYLLLLLVSPTLLAHSVQWSASPDRSEPQSLENASLNGTVYVFIAPSSELSQVQFYIDGNKAKTENVSPWDLGGTAGDNSAQPYDMSALGDGPHRMDVVLVNKDGSVQEQSLNFQVGDPTPTLTGSPASLALNSVEGETATGTLTLSTLGGESTSVVLAENHDWLSLSVASGITPFSVAVSADATGLADGQYPAQITASADGYAPITLNVSLQVGEPAGEDAPQLHLTWNHDQSAVTAVWFTPADGTQSELQYRLTGATEWASVVGSVRHSNEDGWYHQATITPVTRGSQYDYRVRLSSDAFSRVYQTRAQPAPGQSWDLTFVADTGLLGRLDGLTNGTQAVIDAMAAIAPDLILLGGDYAYYDKDKRYGTLERSIDAWFNQMAPLAPFAPMMPVYGNHEILNNEGFEFWHARFPTPAHWRYDGGRMYAFDVGDVHFIAVYALRESNDGIPLDAVAWLESHLAEVKNAGYRWIIPYLHAAPFSDGANHVSAETIRGHIAPLFEAAGVKLVLSAHDQSYERTYPLDDAAGAIIVTDTDTDCIDRQGGITWMKISPGGKMSDKNDGFSPWMTEPPPYWTARRDNTAHHFGHLSFDPGGDVTISVYQVTDGQPVQLFDQFRLTENCDGPSLVAQPTALDFRLAQGETGQQSLLLTHPQSGQVISVSESADWLSLAPASGASPLTITVTADSQGQVSGSRETTIQVDGGDGSLTVPVRLTVEQDGYQLVMNEDSLRSNPRALDGATVASPLYVELLPWDNVRRVRFFIDGERVKTEGVAPYDMAGTGDNDTALPFSLEGYAQGPLALRADIEMLDGTFQSTYADIQYGTLEPTLSVMPTSLSSTLVLPQTQAQLSLSFSGSEPTQVTLTHTASWLNVDAGPFSTPVVVPVTINASGLPSGQYQSQILASSPLGDTPVPVTLVLQPEPGDDSPIQLSLQPDRSGATSLAGQTVSGQIYVFVADDSADKVRFYLNGNAVQTEYNAPWDLAGTSSGSGRPANPFDTTTLSTGPHVLEVEVVGSTSQRYSASFTVTR
ncbi:metallophosphoesterase [Halomonas denitrificans]|nr:metallophosphoesterase [Halomonas denitrificans]